MKIAIILGTRPEIIKFSPIIRELRRKQIDFFIIHTNQHYSENLDKIFFDSLKMPQAKYNLNIGSHSQGKQTGLMLEKIEEVLAEDRPDIVLVQGDTNSSFAGALAAKKLFIKVGHIEAGLRSYDERMPEEINRKLIDHIADFLFAPTKLQSDIMKSEGIKKDIIIVGNTIVDAVKENSELSNKINTISEFGLEKDNYFLVTFHRAENTSIRENLETLLTSFKKIYEKYHIELFCPLHPRSIKMIENFGLELPAGLRITEPIGYLSFLNLMKNARLILTDSGGLQEEACILGIPCVTLRDNTERPETVDVGANIIAGIEFAKIEKAISLSLGKSRNWSNPFGENVARKIVEYLTEQK